MQTNLTCLLLIAASAATAAPVVLKSSAGVEAVFSDSAGRYRLTSVRDPEAKRDWPVAGPLFSLQTEDGFRANLGDVGSAIPSDAPPTAERVTLEATLPRPAVTVRQAFTFCPDGRTLRVRASLRATGEPVTIQRVGLLEIRLPDQALRLVGPGHVSSPVIADRLYAGIEHPAALCQVDGDTMYLAQHSYTHVGSEWVELPSAVIGVATEADMSRGEAGLKRAFLRYLDTVRLHPADMHIHYNNWWTMPVPFTEQDVLRNIAALKTGLYDRTGFFFDSYAMDMGWSNPHTVWQVDRQGYPHEFSRIRDALAEMHCRPGLWVSPSSCYPPALDNAWLAQVGYETTPGERQFACLARGGRYQQAFKDAVVRHARRANLGHVKFDGLVWPCASDTHGHRPGIESYQPIAEGLADVFDALRAQDPTIALEPTCLGYYPSPWWLMHTPYIIGPFGDDCPRGVSPAPEWLEALTTGRDLANLRGQEAFWMPSSALECFDIIVQCPGDMRNHAVMAVARGHWFQSTYINPRYMDAGEWRFFADVMRWARAHRQTLQNPVVFGGDPAKRQPYGYAYLEGNHHFYFIRNPWMEMAQVTLPEPEHPATRELRAIYPCREVTCRTTAGKPLPQVTVGPYETLVLEATAWERRLPAGTSTTRATEPPAVLVEHTPPTCERRLYAAEPAAYGPSWSSPEGDAAQILVATGSEAIDLKTKAELCLLLETKPGSMPGTCSVTLDGKPLALRETGSRGAFAATGAQAVDEWQWFLAPLTPGEHRLQWEARLPDENARWGVFVRGLRPVVHRTASSERPAFPLPSTPGHPWSVTLVPLMGTADLTVVERHLERPVVRIDGVYLDSLDWTEATAGWGTVHRNLSVMGTPMNMAGRTFHRGLGTHALSRISYDLPEGYTRFAATIGCDQEVSANSVVFVVQGDGRELYRSPVMRRDTPLIDLDLPIKGVHRLTLILEDAGDGIIADHGNWADARLLR